MKKRIVIKLGGSVLSTSQALNELSHLIEGFRSKNRDVVVVHGGGPAINLELTSRGIQWQFFNGQRQTTPEMMDVIEEVLGETVNDTVVQSLLEVGIPAIGLSGCKNKILFCSQASQELICVGKVEDVDVSAILKVCTDGNASVPVIAPIGFGAHQKYNVNADWAATKIAIALKAEELIFLTDEKGILDHNKNRIAVATPDMLQELISAGVISGGMCTKVLAMIVALESGIKKVRVLHATDAGKLRSTKKIGTLLKGRTYENASGF